jgi:hypothetical protein
VCSVVDPVNRARGRVRQMLGTWFVCSDVRTGCGIQLGLELCGLVIERSMSGMAAFK